MGAFDRMRLYLQTDYRLDRKFNHLGCAIRSLIAYAEMRYNRRLEPVDIMEITAECFERGFIEDTYDFNDPGGIIEVACEKLGHVVNAYDIATRKGSGTNYYKWVQDIGKYEHMLTLLKWRSDGSEGTHFTLGDKDGFEVFDPYPVDVKKGLIYEILIFCEEAE